MAAEKGGEAAAGSVEGGCEGVSSGSGGSSRHGEGSTRRRTKDTDDHTKDEGDDKCDGDGIEKSEAGGVRWAQLAPAPGTNPLENNSKNSERASGGGMAGVLGGVGGWLKKVFRRASPAIEPSMSSRIVEKQAAGGGAKAPARLPSTIEEEPEGAGLVAGALHAA